MVVDLVQVALFSSKNSLIRTILQGNSLFLQGSAGFITYFIELYRALQFNFPKTLSRELTGNLL